MGKMLLVHHWDTDILMLACVLKSGTTCISVEHALTWLAIETSQFKFH